ncbi:MAG: hypothetical protein Kow00124_04010 [Anaerolineae bacterium]
MSYHVLVSDNLDPLAVDELRATPGITVEAPGKMTREQTLAAIPAAHALIVRSGTRADAELIGAGVNLKMIVRGGVGVDNIDVAAATQRGIVVMNTPDANTIAAAEHTFALILALARHIPAAHASLEAGQWERSRFMGVELRGKTLGLIGFGRIGQAVAKRARAFEMTVLAHDPARSRQAVAEQLGIQLVDLDELCAVADFISLHASLNDSTRSLINRERIAMMKPGVRIINAARGPMVDAAALAEAIRTGHVAGAALDVYEQEPPAPDHPLIGLLGVVHTPHLGASTFDAQRQVGVEAARLVIGGLIKGEYRHVVNPDVLQP